MSATGRPTRGDLLLWTGFSESGGAAGEAAFAAAVLVLPVFEQGAGVGSSGEDGARV